MKSTGPSRRMKTEPELEKKLENSPADSENQMYERDGIVALRRRTTIITHISIFLYAVCFFIQASSLPYLSRKLGLSTVSYGYLETLFALLQLVGGPIFGRFGDLYGGRSALALAFTSACAAYGILGFATNVYILVASRIPVIFMHAMQAGQMVMTDISEHTGRADALGKLGLSYGLGMILGPILGGILTKNYGEREASLFASLLALLPLVLSRVFIPARTKLSEIDINGGTKKTTNLNNKNWYDVIDFKKWVELLKNKKTSVLLALKIAIGIPLGAFQSMFSVIAMKHFGLDPQQNGYVISYIGFLVMIIQGLGMGILVKRFKEEKLIKFANLVLIFAWFGQAVIQNIWQFCVIAIPKAFGVAIQNIIITSALSNNVSDMDTGSILGLSMAINSLVKMVTPTLGGLLLENYGFPSFGYMGCFTSIVTSIALYATI